ncbi:MAG: c-type cytochrome, partial [Rhodospirillales bacterium]
MKSHLILVVSILLWGWQIIAWSNPSAQAGQILYNKHCAECHGDKGQGVEDEYSKPLIGDWPIEKIIRYVDKTMPDYEPGLVKGREAEEVSRFIFESFYQKPEL